MAQFGTLTEALESNLIDAKGVVYIEADQNERELSYRNLYERSLGILHILQEKGLLPGDELIIFLTNNEQFIDVFWACLFGGIVPVPVAVGISEEHRHKLLRIFETLENPYLYTNATNLARVSSYAEAHDAEELFSAIKNKTLLVDEIHDISKHGEEYSPTARDIAFIQFSSGSTSKPKGVVLTHRNILANINAIIEGANLTASDKGLSWMPLTHDMGLIGFHLTMIVLGMHHYLMSTELFVRRPLLWLQKTSEKRANLLCSPNFGYKHVLKVFDANKLHGIDLSHVRLIFNGAEPISSALCNQFLRQLAPFGLNSNAMFAVYGLAEASLAVSFPEVNKELKTLYVDRSTLNTGSTVQVLDAGENNAVGFVSVGRPVRDCQVRLVDDENIQVNERSVGHIYIKGDNVTGGYYRNDLANEQMFDSEGWLDTGDLGFMLDGQLYVTGRAKEIIFVNGQNYFPHDLEAIVQQAERLELGKVVVTGTRPDNADVDDILVFILYRGRLEEFVELANEVERALNEKAGIDITHVVPVKRIPKTTSGKIQRHLLEDSYIRGEFSEIITGLNQLRAENKEADGTGLSEVEQKLKLICDTAIADKRVSIHDNLFEIGTSSLVLVQIHEGIEETFPGVVDITDLFDHPTITELAVFIESKTKPENFQ